MMNQRRRIVLYGCIALLSTVPLHVFAAGASGSGTPASIENASWVWGAEDESSCQLRKVFSLNELPRAASVAITADNGYELYLNGSRVGGEAGAGSEFWQSVERYDVKSRLTKGQNVIGIRGVDLGGVRGVIASLRIEFKKQKTLELLTDASWRTVRDGNGVNYSHPEFVEGAGWSDVRVIGPMGIAPWGRLPGSKILPGQAQAMEVAKPGADFSWPKGVAFLGDDCSVYVPLRGDAWGVAFRVGDWSRAYTEFDLPCPSKIGRKLYLLQPGVNSKPRVLFDVGQGAIGSPNVSFDGKFMLVAMAREGEKFFHIYRISVAGGEPQRLTDGPFHDIDPAELPDGRIVFTSTRIGTFEEYHQPPSRALFRMNADGNDIHQITSTLIFDNEPKVMADGRIAFIRTDNFFDRGKVETHLHVIRPDGTDGFTEVGANVGANYGSRLRAFGYGSPAPLPNGQLAFISNRGNFIASPGEAESDFLRLPDHLGDITPLPDGRLLATVLRPENGKMISDVLAVIDPGNNKPVGIFQSDNGSIHSPVFLGARPQPRVIPDYVDRNHADQPGATGFLLCQNARFTTKTKADWDNIRAIRVLGAAPLTIRSSHSHIVHVGHETIELGTVPLSPDGSFFVEVPADTPLALQAVDAEGRSELNEMSWIYVRPGERRSCVGCHQPREAAPALDGGHLDALRSPPVKLLGQGNAHRFRGNNAGVTGLMDLQFERFRECASLNRQALRGEPLASGHDEIAALLQQLEGDEETLKISAAQRLAILRSSEAAPFLAKCLSSTNREVLVATALALASCGTRSSVPALLSVVENGEAVVAQAAAVALENITGRPGGLTEDRSATADWRGWLAANSWEQIEQSLLRKLADTNEASRSAIVALGHIGSRAACDALSEFVAQGAQKNPYPVFEKHNRTDNFTFSAGSSLNPRTMQEAVRALGQLKATNAVPLLRTLLTNNIAPETGNLFLAEAAIEALGRIALPECETALIEAFGALKDYWDYVGWYSDHPALYACHASPLHARIIQALDSMGSTRAAEIVPQLLRSVPTDPDRGLFLDNDDYETMVGRLIRRSGRADDAVETCLAVLGDADSNGKAEFKAAVTNTHPAWAGHPGPQNRAAQLLSLVCRDKAKESQVRAAFARFRDLPEEPVKRTLGNPDWTPVRHWVLFYLARTLGQLGDSASVETLTAVLSDNLNEARHGRPDPSQPEIHYLQLDYTPCWRASAAWALGQIGDRAAVPVLLGALRNMDNAIDVRHAAAKALGQIADPASLSDLKQLAATYPEISIRRVLRQACEQLQQNPENRLVRTGALK
jgi:HEAT repeat protein